MNCNWFIDERVVGHVCEWDLSSGDQKEHNVHGDAVSFIALSGDMVVASDNVSVIRVLNIRTCSFVSPSGHYK